MIKCTLHNLLTSCTYDQVFWIYRCNDYDQNLLLAKGTKQEIFESEEGFDVLDHINDVVKIWTIREDGAMFIKLEWDEKAEDIYFEDYVKKWDRFNPDKRPWLYSAEMDNFMHTIQGSSEYMHPYGKPTKSKMRGDADDE